MYVHWMNEVWVIQQQVLCGVRLLYCRHLLIKPLQSGILWWRNYCLKSILDKPVGHGSADSSEAHTPVWLGNMRLIQGWVTKQTAKQLPGSSDLQHVQYFVIYNGLSFSYVGCIFLCQCFICFWSTRKEVELRCSKPRLSVLDAPSTTIQNSCYEFYEIFYI